MNSSSGTEMKWVEWNALTHDSCKNLSLLVSLLPQLWSFRIICRNVILEMDWKVVFYRPLQAIWETATGSAANLFMERSSFSFLTKQENNGQFCKAVKLKMH